jgi:DHA2 family methylenomycin A resistance protein-like MFS transporter
VQLDVTIVNVTLPTVAKSLSASVAGLQWVVDTYTLSFAAGCSPRVCWATCSARGGLFGRFRSVRRCLARLRRDPRRGMAGGGTGGAGIGRGARGSQFFGLAMLNHATGHDPRLRARAIGLWTAAGGISIGAGPVIGGLLIASLGWRNIFSVDLPVCAAGAAQTLAFAPESPHGDSNRRMDLPGRTLAILALFGLIGGVIEARPLGLSHLVVLGSTVPGRRRSVHRRGAADEAAYSATAIFLPIQASMLPSVSV